jgi:hypothetical protein
MSPVPVLLMKPVRLTWWLRQQQSVTRAPVISVIPMNRVPALQALHARMMLLHRRQRPAGPVQETSAIQMNHVQALLMQPVRMTW